MVAGRSLAAFALSLAVALAPACGGSSHGSGGAQTPGASTTETGNGGGGGAGTKLDAALAARQQAEDAQIPGWYDPQQLTADVRPEALHAMTGGPLDQLTLYDLDLDIDAAARTFHLTERVYFQNRTKAPMSDLVLRMYANTPRDGEPPEKLVSGHCVQITCTVEPLGRDALTVHPAQPIAAGARLRVVLHVDGTLRVIDASRTTMMAAAMSSLKTIMPGLAGGGGAGGGGTADANGDYGLLGAGDDILSFGNFYPVLARRRPIPNAPRGSGDGEDWDLDQSTLGDIGPDAMSHVRAHVELPAGWVVAASGVVTHEETAGNRHRIDYAAGCMRDFALLASDKFNFADKVVDGVKVRSYFRGSDRPTGEKVLDVGAWSLRDFQKRFGMYPYRELALVEEALVGGAGGVEFAGLATVASMFYKPSGAASGPGGAAGGGAGGGGLEALLGGLMGTGGNDGPMKAGAAEFTTAHEVGHQWWHGAVGSDSRLHPWQDEALAQFSAMIYSEDRYGAARAKREADMNARMGYEMMRLMGEPDGAVDAPAGKQSQLAYGGLVYGKGPYFYVAMRKLLGDAAFFGALQAYVKQYYLGFAPAGALVDAMAHAAGFAKSAKVAALSHRWLDESHGDDDLGKASFGSLLAMAGGKGAGGGGGGGGGLGGLLGGGGAGGAGGAGGPDIQQLMKMLGGSGGAGGNADMMKLLQQLMGGGGAGGAGGAGTGDMMKDLLGP
jgi:hypothetical protein